MKIFGYEISITKQDNPVIATLELHNNGMTYCMCAPACTRRTEISWRVAQSVFHKVFSQLNDDIPFSKVEQFHHIFMEEHTKGPEPSAYGALTAYNQTFKPEDPDLRMFR